MEATKHRECPHIAYPSRLHRGGRSIAGDALTDPLMRPVLVEIGRVLPEHAPQVPVGMLLAKSAPSVVVVRYAGGVPRERARGGAPGREGPMSLRPQAVYVVPEDTARVARAAFPKGNP